MKVWKKHEYFDLNKKEHVYHIDLYLESNEFLEINVCNEKECIKLREVPPLTKIHLEICTSPSVKALE